MLLGAGNLFVAKIKEIVRDKREPCLIKLLAARINFHKHTQRERERERELTKTCVQHIEHFSLFNFIEFITY